MAKRAASSPPVFKDIRIYIRSKQFSPPRRSPAPEMSDGPPPMARAACGSEEHYTFDPECSALSRPCGKHGGIRPDGRPVDPVDLGGSTDEEDQAPTSQSVGMFAETLPGMPAFASVGATPIEGGAASARDFIQRRCAEVAAARAAGSDSAAEEVKPAGEVTPAEEVKPPARSGGGAGAAEEVKPAEEVTPAEEVQPPAEEVTPAEDVGGRPRSGARGQPLRKGGEAAPPSPALAARCGRARARAHAPARALADGVAAARDRTRSPICSPTESAAPPTPSTVAGAPLGVAGDPTPATPLGQTGADIENTFAQALDNLSSLGDASAWDRGRAAVSALAKMLSQVRGGDDAARLAELVMIAQGEVACRDAKRHEAADAAAGMTVQPPQRLQIPVLAPVAGATAPAMSAAPVVAPTPPQPAAIPTPKQHLAAHGIIPEPASWADGRRRRWKSELLQSPPSDDEEETPCLPQFRAGAEAETPCKLGPWHSTSTEVYPPARGLKVPPPAAPVSRVDRLLQRMSPIEDVTETPFPAVYDAAKDNIPSQVVDGITAEDIATACRFKASPVATAVPASSLLGKVSPAVGGGDVAGGSAPAVLDVKVPSDVIYKQDVLDELSRAQRAIQMGADALCADALQDKLKNFYGLGVMSNLPAPQHGDAGPDGHGDASADAAEKRAKKMAEEEEMWEELKRGSFMFQTRGEKISSMWNRALAADSKLKEDYKNTLGLPNKAKFRADWGEKRYKQFWERRSKTTTNRKSEKLSGKYLALARIAHKEGGGKDGLKAATTYATNCIILGKHWVKWDSMTNTLKFYYVEHEISDEYVTAWTAHEEWCNAPQPVQDALCLEGGGAAGPSAMAADGSDGASTCGGALAKAKAKAKGKAAAVMRRPAAAHRDDEADEEAALVDTTAPEAGELEEAGGACEEAGDDDDGEPPVKREKTSLDVAMADFKKEKSLFRGLMQQTSTTLDLIESNSERDWAKNEQNRGALESARQTVQTAVNSAAALKELLAVNDYGDMKARIGASQLEVNFQKGATALKEPLKNLQTAVSRILRMHKQTLEQIKKQTSKAGKRQRQSA
ncbi:unnamed protein product [Prorocentrum cordatum]|uniref:Uncharacterized protein n=1 Tax=Prorocentrum cordatum TaxID=2364126 RepID=A0ABN9W4G4_9DINO|nr:unnamed protein product [Polarella glacialis]